MRVIVPSPTEVCVADFALRTEGVPHETYLLRGPYAYGQLLARIWKEGTGFIVVEHDIAPWPTALRLLAMCSQQYCGHYYPMANGGEVGGALGCTKFGTTLVVNNPDLVRTWPTVEWKYLDAEVISTVDYHLKGHFHLHSPPVAHVRTRQYGPDNIYVNPVEAYRRDT